jgi:hypothetical protein
MASVTLKGSTSGQISLQPAAVAGSNTLTLPAATGTLIYGTQPSGTIVGTTDAQTLTNKTLTSPTLTSPTISGAIVSAMASSVITAGTAQATTSGTAIEFTSIPSWARRVTIMFNGLGSSSTGVPLIQLGTASSYETSSYAGSGVSGTTAYSLSSGFALRDVWTSSVRANGVFTITLLDSSSNLWSATGLIGRTDIANFISVSGSKTLASALTRVRLYIDGTQTFTAGSANFFYE